MIYICKRGNQYCYLDEDKERTLWLESMEKVLNEFSREAIPTSFTLKNLQENNTLSKVKVVYEFNKAEDIKDALPEYFL